jgi:hypothetical protein
MAKLQLPLTRPCIALLRLKARFKFLEKKKEPFGKYRRRRKI